MMANCGKLNQMSTFAQLNASATFMFKHIASLKEQHKEKKSSVRSDKIGLGDFLKGCDFYLTLYPCGDSRTTGDCCVMYLEFDIAAFHDGTDEVVKYNVDYSIALMSNGKKYDDVSSGEKLFGYDPNDDDPVTSWGSKLFEYTDDFAQDLKTLVVQLDLSVTPYRDPSTKTFVTSMPCISVDREVFANRLKLIEEQTSDQVLIKIDGVEPECIIKCSKSALSCSSDTFKRRLNSLEWKKEEKYDYLIRGYECAVVKKFLKFVQSGSFFEIDDFDSMDELIQILKIADEYLVTWMKDDVTNKIIPWMCIENAVECLVAADDAHCARLSDASINFCYQNYADLSITNEWAMIRKERPHLVISVLEEFTRRNMNKN